jgi:hypothetical protein
MLSDYEIRVSIGGFEEKWVSFERDSRCYLRMPDADTPHIIYQMYLVAEFVTYPKKTSKHRRSALPGTQSLNFIPPISQPPSGTGTPTSSSAAESRATTPEQMDVALAAAAKQKSSVAGGIREDGSVLHCFSVSTYCFKMGRLTVPPVSSCILEDISIQDN